jgi:hypothetical protein
MPGLRDCPPTGRMPAASYRFCDVALSLRAACASAIADFDRAYGAFRQATPPTSQARVACCIETDESGRGHVAVDGRRREVAMPDPGSAYAAAIVWDAVAATSQTHFFLHASAVCLDGHAILLAGSTGQGKSTLAAAMAESGAEPLNDDITPVERATGFAEHFPKGEPDAAVQPELRRPVRAVTFLGPADLGRQLHIAIDKLPDAWHERPPWEPSWRVSVRRHADHWELRTASAPPGTAELLRGACSSAGVTVLRDLRPPEPSFGQTPRLQSMPPALAMPRLVAELFGRGDQPATRLAWDLATTLARATFWELSLGPPDTTAQVIVQGLRDRPDWHSAEGTSPSARGRTHWGRSK